MKDGNLSEERQAAPRFDAAELEKFELYLLERRRLLLKDVLSLEEAEARDAPEFPEGATHPGEAGSDQAASDLTLGYRGSASEEIQEIDEALERLRDGTFGRCESCGVSMARERLEAIPYARLCLPCKKLEEA